MHVEVDTAVALIGITSIHNLLHQLDLLDDVARSQRLNTGAQHIQAIHGCMVAVGVVLGHLHRLQLLQTGLLGNLVLTLIGVVLQMSHVGDVAHIAHLVADMCQVTEKHVEGNGRAGMAQMAVAVNGRTAHIHAHMVGRDGSKKLFLMRKCIVNQ